jgi:hypothetical protein
MAKQKVQGFYLASFAIDNNTFTLSDSSREETATIAADLDIKPTLIGGEYGGQAVTFDYNSILKIKRVKLDAAGAPGLQRPYNVGQCFAGIMGFNLVAQNDAANILGSLFFRIPNYGDWTDVNTTVKPFVTAATFAGVKSYKLVLKRDLTSFNYDGYKISIDYVGQEWRPVVTLEFETNGVYNPSFLLI